MATNLPSCFSIEFLEQLLKFLVNFTLLKYDKSWGSYGFLITKELSFGFKILDLKDRFSASLRAILAFQGVAAINCRKKMWTYKHTKRITLFYLYSGLNK